MHIDFERSGGFAGLRLRYRVNTDELAQKFAEELLRLVKASGVLNLQPSDVAPKSPGPPDAFSYRLSVSEGGKVKSLVFNDVTIPAKVRPLLAFLQEQALK